MNIQHNAHVLVADGQKFLLLRNSGNFDEAELICEASGEQENPAAHEQGTDQPGRAFASSGTARSAMDQTDFHRLQKDRFADDVADIVNRLAQDGTIEHLVVVAPSRTLAELRQALDERVSAKVVAEIDKDLTNHPVPEIAAILSRE